VVPRIIAQELLRGKCALNLPTELWEYQFPDWPSTGALHR
jgi:hypothetical protein